ncbi:type VI secretion system protein ImpH [Acinetobacter calcoaceticus]|uniref:Type VI secretion system protein ImpH n=1 Tax=Acinetobacter calcoaceticus TaxID=471 RepID=A0A4R1XWB2_ACICA|nr:type VI secretion system protein ImpH [Acinetobacter calcoaceticus]
MYTQHRWQETSVTDAIWKKPTAFEFVQITRLLRHVPEPLQYKQWGDAFHFESSLNLNYPQAEVEHLTLVDQRYALTNLIVGLTGIQGALPYTYTTKIKQAPRATRQEIQQFLSLFNHKLTTQYVDASLSYHLAVRYEVEAENHYLNILHALNGYIRVQHNQSELDDYFAEFSGLMQGQNNAAHALKTMLSCVFHQQVQIHEFIEEKFQLAEDQMTKLGGVEPSRLGMNSFCGQSLRQAEGKIEIEIGPLSYRHYLEYLPQGKLSQKLKSILQTWCSPTLLVDLRLILAKEEVKPVRLSANDQVGLAQGAFLMPKQIIDNHETCYGLIRGMAC